MADFALYSASWGGVRFWVQSLRFPGGRDLVVHSPSSGDAHVVQDRGPTLRKAQLSMVLADFPGTVGTPADRLRELLAMVADGRPRVFSHPVYGSYLASMGEFTSSIGDDSTPVVECELLPVEEIQALTAIGGGVDDLPNTAGIDAAANALDAQLEEVGLSSAGATADARSCATAWEDGASARQVLVDVERITAAIGAELEDLGLADDLALWPALRAYVELADAVTAGANATAGAAPVTFQLLLTETASLRPLMSAIYGAAEADARYEEAIAANDLRAPGRIPAGTTLTLAAVPPRPRSA